MKQVCISSTVSNIHLTLNRTILSKIQGLELQLLDKELPFWSFSGKNLDLLINELEYTINGLLTELKPTNQQNIEIEFKGITYKLDFRNNFHFEMSALIDFYNMTTITQRHIAHLYIFNKDLIKLYYGESIIAQLRGTNGLTKDQLYNKINSLWQQLKLSQTTDKDVLQKGIENLMSYGLVYEDERNGEYSVTATGYMYW
jgi:hypothetical protein